MQNKSRQSKRRRRIWLILGIIGGIIAVLCIGTTVITVMIAPAQTATPISVTQVSRAAPAHAPTKAPTTAPKLSPTPISKPSPTMAVTHSQPHVGGPISDYYGKYGQPNNQGNNNSETWITDAQQNIFISAKPNLTGEVIWMSLVGSESWSRLQTESYCIQFLPDDAISFNKISSSSDTLFDYHSSVGEIVMDVVDGGSCVILIGGLL